MDFMQIYWVLLICMQLPKPQHVFACLLIDVIEYSSLYMMAGEEVFRS